MKHWRTRGSIKDGRRQPRFVFKKVNKQLISVVGSTLLLVGNYALIPIQVFANETPEITNEQPMSTESELPTLTTSESLPAGKPTDTTTPSTEKPPTADPAPEEPKTEPTTDTTDTDSLEPTEETKEKQLRMPPQAPTDWYAEEENGYMVIKSYNGNGAHIKIPSEIDNKPVQIDLKAVLSSYHGGIGAAPQTFEIEAAGNSGPVKVTGTFASLFTNNSVLTSATFSDADFSEITDMSRMFDGCNSLNSVDVSNWDTANVRNMSNMFRDCSSLSSVDVSSWNTTSVTDMKNMFQDCSNLTSVDVSNWNTANVNDMSQMFANCSSLSSVGVSNWNTANVTNMRYMFYSCSNFTSLDISNWDTTNGTDMNQLFANCTKLSELTCSKTFKMEDKQKLRGLPAAENSGKTTYHWVMDDREKSYDSTNDLISGHNGLYDTDVHTYTIQKKHAVSFDTDGGSDAPAATTIWDQEVLADPDYKGTKNDHTFIGWKVGGQPYNFTQAVTQPLDLKADWEQAEWVTEDAGTYTKIIGYNGTGENIKVPSMLHGKPVEIDLWAVLGSYMSGHGAENETFEIEESKNGEKPVKITGKFTILFAQNSNLRSVEFSDADFSEITDMSYMFAGCSSLNSVDVSKWNMENVTKLESMFEMCSSLTSVDVSKWNTKNVEDMSSMFRNCSNLTSLDLSNWDTANVTNMSQMFDGCSNLSSLDMSNWDTTNVTDMNQLFANCTNLSELTCSKTFKMEDKQKLRGLPNAENSGKTTYHWVMDDREKSYDSTTDLISGHNGLSDTKAHTYTIQKKHAVSFDADGGSDAPAATTIWDKGKVADPDYKGKKRDHTFIGWKLGDQPYNFSKQVTEPLELKADWRQGEWVTEDAGTYTKIIGYNGTGENIKVPSMLHGKPVEINLKAVLGSDLGGPSAKTKTFEIEESKNGELPVKVTGSFASLFNSNLNLTSVAFSDADTSAITDMNGMLADCRNLSSVDVSNWDTANVKDMQWMFVNCSSLNSVDVSKWDTANVTNMTEMFVSCSNLTSLDMSNWNTKNVTSMWNMFNGCSNLSSLDMSNWDTANVTNMSQMFDNCSNLSELTCSKSFKMEGNQALRGLPSAENNGKTTYHWVMDDRKNSYDSTNDLISGHNGLSDTKAHSYTIQKKHAVTFDTDGGSEVPAATTIWDKEKVADPDYKGKKRDHTFTGWKAGDKAYDFSKQVTEPLELKADWKQGEWVTEDAGTYTKIIGYNGTGETIKVPSLLHGKPVEIDLGAVLDQHLNGTTQTFEIEAAKNGERPVKVTGSFANLFDGNTKLTSAKFADADTSAITDMSGMFINCSNLSSVDMSKWDTANVKKMNHMFFSCSSLTSLDVSNWNTEKVEDMRSVFAGCSSLISLDMSEWNTGSVEDMSYMFISCSNLSSLDMSNWDTANVTNMSQMFFSNLKLSELTCSKSFEMDAGQMLRGLPPAENDGKTTYHWVMDDREKSYDSTTDLISGHNGLSDTKAHTYTIQKKHAVSFDVDGGSDSPSATTIWDKGKVADPDYKGTKRDHTFIGWKAGDQPYDFSKQVTEPLELKADWEQGEWVTVDAGTYTKIIGYNGTGENIKVPSILYDNPVEIDLGAVLGSSMSGTFAKTKTFEIEAAKNGEKPVKVTGSFNYLFASNMKLTSAKFADADTSAITDMNGMFNGCSNLSSVDVSKWDTANVKSMNHMFFSCSSLSSLDVSKWDTEKVEDMRSVFTGCSSLNSLDVSNWNTANVTDMSGMFASCSNLSSLDMSNWDTAKVTNMLQMFAGCPNLSVLTCSKTFKMSNNQTLRGLPTAENNGKTTYHWVMDDRKKSYDLTNDLISGHNGLSDMKVHTYTIQKKHAVAFDTDGGSDAPPATTIWDKGKVTDPDYKGTKRDHTFIGWKAGDQPYDFSKQVTEPLELKADWKQGEWVTEDAGTYTRIIGYNGTGETIKVPSILYNKPVEIDLRTVLNQHLRGTTQTFEIEAAKNGELPVKVTGSFEDLFNNNRKLTSAKFADAETSAIKNMSWMFYNCSNLNSVDVSQWDTKNVEEMERIFSGCSNLSSVDVSNWNTANVNNMSQMFINCSSLSSVDVSNWNTANVTNMNYMFVDCSNLSSVDVSQWDTENVTSMWSMFGDCSSLTSLDLSKWNTTNRTDMDRMFANCTKLSELTCSKSFKMTDDQALHGLPTAENDGKTTYHWVMDDGKESYDSTTDLVSGHNSLSDTKAHTYTIQKKHEVAFNVAGGSPEIAAKKVLENKTVTDPNYQGTKANHQFDGWTLDGKPFDFDQTKIAAPIQLTAAWRLNQYSIQFDKNGGTGTMQGQTLTYDEEKTLLPNAFNRTGYTFAGWNTQADGQGERSYTDQQAVKNLSAKDGETVTLYAQWRAHTYQIDFDPNTGEGTQAPQELRYDQEAKLAENRFTKKGYTFSGWNTQKDGNGKAYKNTETIKNLTAVNDAKITLFAQWTMNTYTITFDSKGGEAVSDKKYTVETETFKLPEQKRKGYTFHGWYDGENKVETIEKGTTGNKALVAKWEAIAYNVTFDSAGGSDVPVQHYTIEKGLTDFTTPTRKGYTFQGWYDGKDKVESIKTGETGDRTLTAKWTMNTYTITFDSKGGEAVSDKKYTVETESFKLPELKRKGYTFHGWYDGENKVETIEKGTTGNKALVAKWEAVEYSVTFDSAGGSDVPIQHYTIEKGLADLTTPTKKGYTFQGWYDGKDKVESIKTGETGDRALTAKWTINTYTITFDSKGAGDIPTKVYNVETESFKLPELGRKGYTFHGWYDGETKIETIEKGTIGNKALVAKWEAIEYKVTFDSAGGSDVPVQRYTIEKGLTDLTTPTKKGYTFQGWYDGKDKVESIKTGETGDRALTAKWTMNTYTITFDDAALAPITYTVESENIALPKKERLGYTFLGWRVSEDTLARSVTDQGQIIQTIPTGTTGNLRLSAQWQANSYEVIVDPNGGAGTRASQRLTYDKAEKLAKNTFTRDGYSFTGWNTQADGKGTAYTDQQEVKNLVAEANGSLTLFAQWKPMKAALEDVIAKEQEAKRDKNKYTKESWDTYEKALENAKKVLADANAAPEQIRAALAELTTAIAQLKPIEIASGKTTGSTTRPTAARKTYPTSAKRYPPTGMLTGSGLTILGVAAVGTALASWKKRNKKD